MTADPMTHPSPEAVERDWPEDFGHENGNYQNTCQTGLLGGCGLTFRGHKRRVICRACSQRSEKLGALIESARASVASMGPVELAMMHAAQTASFIRAEFPEGADDLLAKNHLHVLAAHVTALTAQLEAERATGDETARHISRLLDHLARETARADAAEAEAKALREAVKQVLPWLSSAAVIEFAGPRPAEILRATLAQPADGGK